MCDAETSGKDNYAVAIPRTARRWPCIRQRLGWSACDLDFFKLSYSGSKKTDVTTVQRPEWVSGFLGSRQWLRGEGIERANPKKWLAVSADRPKNEPKAIRRDVLAAVTKNCFLRRKNKEARGVWLRRPCAAEIRNH